LRNLDTINPAFLKPPKITGISAFVLCAMGLLSIPLADGAAPHIPLSENPILLLSCIALGFSSILATVPAICRWGWKAKYYGVSFLCFASVSFLAIVPFLAVVLYGSAPYWAKAVIMLGYGASHLFWCRKFAVLYRNVFNDEVLRAAMYEEEADAVYYMRRGDEFILRKHFKFSQMPRDRYFVLFMIIAFLLIPAMRTICGFIGVPFVHIFLLVAMLPVSWMSIGFAVRGFLIFYMYPAKIKKATGKDVFVDLVSKHRPVGKRRKSSGTTP
jgi:predicted neutral ceramidase superfamily lipid hydrolase